MTELIRMMAAKTGQRYLIIMTEDLLSAERAAFLRHFFFNTVYADHAGNEQAGRDSRNRHHDGVR